MRAPWIGASFVAWGLFVTPVRAEPHPVSTEVLGVLTGDGARLHRRNQSPHRLRYYGTDLGWSYEHQGRLHFLFGDTWATESYAPIEAATGSLHDDGFGWLELGEWRDPARVSPENLPIVELGQEPGSAEMSALDPGHAMDLGKTPVAAFSNGSRELALFLLGKPLPCAVDEDCAGLSCDPGLGYRGPKPTDEAGFTLVCADDEPGCIAATLPEAETATGFCSDTGSSVGSESTAGRVAAVARTLRIGVRDLGVPKRYAPVDDWVTTRFINTAARAVDRFDLGDGTGAGRSVLLWGRPGFVGIGAKSRSLALYFAVAEMPEGPDWQWKIRYFAGLDAAGRPRFSDEPIAAAALDLDATKPGVQAEELHDITNQMSVVWVAALDKWLMLYSGGMSRLPRPGFGRCGVLEVFAGAECTDVVVGDGAIRMRTADHPWGPWSSPQDVIASGDPSVAGSGQFGDGGVLHHPDCTAAGCAPHTESPLYGASEHGFFYAPNIIERWIRPVAGGVEVIWNASTWDPYRVVLLRTQIEL